jgi:3-oxoacyl-[acyl-carrier-protein] synthase II
VTRIVVRGIGAVGGFGSGVAALGRALSGPAPRPGRMALSVPGSPPAIPAFLADTSPLKEFIPARTLRRVDHFSRLALLGAHLALADAGLPEADRGPLSVVVASGHGATGITLAFQDSFILDGDICASPTHFANSLHNSAAANISILLGAAGPSLTVSQFGLSVPSALLAARQWLLEGRVDRVLFGAVDELSQLTGHYWYREHAATPEGEPPDPLDLSRESAVPGEGAAFLLLSRREDDAAAGYCTLDDVSTGLGAPPPVPSSPGLLVLGADGDRGTGRRYAEAAAGARISCHTPAWGSLPAAPAFDLAAAALAIRDGRAFPTPGAAPGGFPARVAEGGEPVGDGKVRVLTLDPEGFGVATLGRPDDGGPAC